MSRRRVRLWAIGCLVAPILIFPVSILAATGFWLDGKHSGSYSIGIAVVCAGLAIYFVTIISAFVHVWRRSDLERNERRWWFVGLYFLNGFVLPYFWLKMIRPLEGRPAPTA